MPKAPLLAKLPLCAISHILLIGWPPTMGARPDISATAALASEASATVSATNAAHSSAALRRSWRTPASSAQVLAEKPLIVLRGARDQW